MNVSICRGMKALTYDGPYRALVLRSALVLGRVTDQVSLEPVSLDHRDPLPQGSIESCCRSARAAMAVPVVARKLVVGGGVVEVS